ncbi:MAG: hypothetical protein RLZZ454_1936 [Pseudomonadota bacterium]
MWCPAPGKTAGASPANSVAEVQADGPFSCFVGVQRWFAVLSGAGVRLRIGAAAPYEEHALTPASAPFCFDGALPLDCTLIDGATQDFNLMVRADQARAQMQRVVGSLQTEGKGPRSVAIWSGDTDAALWLDKKCTHVSANTLAWQDLPAKAVLKVMASNALLMEIDLCP